MVDSKQVEADAKSAERVSGCFWIVWQGMVTIPLWYLILFMVLVQIDAPPKLWVAFYCYLPASIIGFMISAVIRIMNTRVKPNGTS